VLERFLIGLGDAGRSGVKQIIIKDDTTRMDTLEAGQDALRRSLELLAGCDALTERRMDMSMCLVLFPLEQDHAAYVDYLVHKRPLRSPVLDLLCQTIKSLHKFEKVTIIPAEVDCNTDGAALGVLMGLWDQIRVRLGELGRFTILVDWVFIHREGTTE
jgi:hypothetical protein